MLDGNAWGCINPSTKIKVAVQKNLKPRPLDKGNAALA